MITSTLDGPFAAAPTSSQDALAEKLRRLRIDGAVKRSAMPSETRAVDRPQRRWLGTILTGACVGLLAAVGGYAVGRAAPAAGTAPVSVAAAPVAFVPPPAAVVAAGHVIARRQATIAAPVTGRINSIEVEEGQRIAAGGIIARIDADGARASVDDAAASLRAARADIDRIAARRDEAIATRGRFLALDARGFARGADVAKAVADVAAIDADLQRARAMADSGSAGLAGARVALERMVVRAPFSGIVTRLSAQPGEIISPVSGGGGFTRTGICTIVDMESLEVEVDISEAQISRIRAGQAAMITLDAYGERPYRGRVLAVVPVADRARATFRVRVGFLETDARLMPEMAVQIAFAAAKRA